jgi:predicted porin
MKKYLIAAAVAAAVAVPAAAQVTIYGQLDVSQGQDKVSGDSTAASNTKTSGLKDDAKDSSRLGFRGNEDLGGGLKAGFVYELNLDTVAGQQTDKSAATTPATATTTRPASSNAFFGSTRQSFVSLGGGFGNLVVGYKKTTETDFNDAFMIGTENSAGHRSHTSGRVTRANGIYYTTPSFNGLQAQVQYSNNKATTAAVTEDIEVKMVGIAATFKTGNLVIGANVTEGDVNLGTGVDAADIFIKVSAPSSAVFTPALNNDYKASGIGASYNFGVARVAATMAERKYGRDDQTLAKSEYQSVSVAMPMGNVELIGAFSKRENTSANTTSVNNEVDGYQLIANYNLSKRTGLYALYGSEKQDTLADADDPKTTTFRVGVTHKF